MHSSPVAELRPSWLGAILFALVMAIFSVCLGWAYSEMWISWPSMPAAQAQNDTVFAQYVHAGESRERMVIWTVRGAGLLGAVVAAWAWRSSWNIRYHVAFVAGLSLLVATLFYIRTAERKVWIYIWEAEGQARPISSDTFVVQAPLLCLFSGATGLILILTALNLDQISRRRGVRLPPPASVKTARRIT